jgi:hypothetical protein
MDCLERPGEHRDTHKSIVFWTSFFYASMTGLYTCLYVMAAELFPTTVRSTGVALCSTFGRIASVLAMFVNGALFQTPALLLSVGGTMLMTGCILSVVFPPNEMRLIAVMDTDWEDYDISEGDIVVQPAAKLGRRASELKYLAG